MLSLIAGGITKVSFIYRRYNTFTRIKLATRKWNLSTTSVAIAIFPDFLYYL